MRSNGPELSSSYSCKSKRIQNLGLTMSHLQQQSSSHPTAAPGPTPASTDFVKKLYQMLEENELDSVVNWAEDGESFIIYDHNAFTTKILPRYFKHSNFASFVRQLNKYDFHKVKNSVEAKQKAQKGQNDNIWQFKHQDFNRFDVSSLDNIRRKVPTKKEPTEVTSLANCVSLASFRKLEERVISLERENSSLNSSLENMNSSINNVTTKYNSVVDSLITTQNISCSLSRSLETLSKVIIGMGGHVPPIELPHLDILAAADPSVTHAQHQHILTHNHQSASNSNSNSISISNPNANPYRNSNDMSNSTAAIVGQTQSDPSTDTPILGRPSASVSASVSVSIPGAETGMTAVQQQQQQQPLPSTGNSHGTVLDPQSRMANRPEGSKLHVLLVEDESVCIQLCTKFLTGWGCTVEVVHDGFSAIGMAEKVKFDLVLMDIVMPNLDGASATSVIRSFDADTPIVAMTGSYRKDDLLNYLNHGMTDILAKPFTKKDLHDILRKHIATGLPSESPLMQSQARLESQTVPSYPLQPSQHSTQQHMQQQQQQQQQQHQHQQQLQQQLQQQQQQPLQEGKQPLQRKRAPPPAPITKPLLNTDPATVAAAASRQRGSNVRLPGQNPNDVQLQQHQHQHQHQHQRQYPEVSNVSLNPKRLDADAPADPNITPMPKLLVKPDPVTLVKKEHLSTIVPSVPVHDDLLTPTLLQNTGLTPSDGSMGGLSLSAMNMPLMSAPLSATDTVGVGVGVGVDMEMMDVGGDVVGGSTENEYGDMFKRRRMQ